MSMRTLIALLLLSGTGFAQSPAPAPAPQTSAATSQPAALLAFEVTAIKLNKSDSGNSNSDFDNGRFTATNVSLKNLIQYEAYGIPGPQILGGPKWFESTRFDIDAKLDAAGAEQVKALDRQQRKLAVQGIFQQFLADRFKMTAHWETRELPVYALVIAKKGSQLKPAKDTEVGNHISANRSEKGSQLNATGVTLEDLAKALTQQLAGELGRPVIDKTGIKGRVDADITWTPDSGSASLTGATDRAAAPVSGPTIFTAIEEQLGLKLESTKGPVRVLVVDHAEMPTAN